MRPAFLIDAPAAPAAEYLPAPAAEPARATVRCANCGSEGCEQYCPRCGQETHDLHRSLHGILGELLDAFAGWDGKIPTTLWLMVRRPGALTREFLGGHRARYLRPLRLYLTMSVLFFVSMSLVESPTVVQANFPIATGGRTAITGADGVIRSDSAFDAFLARHRNEKGNAPAAWVKRHFVGGMIKLQTLPPRQQKAVLKNAFFEKAPNMVFLLLPVFALLLRLLYLRTPVYYAEHFVFALHNHAFAYFAMTLAHLASVWLRPTGYGAVAALPVLWMPVYFFVSMRRVYGGSRRRTAAKFVALAGAYGTVLFAAVVVTALVSLVTLA
jgi:uncharacterized protein DUF3667